MANEECMAGNQPGIQDVVVSCFGKKYEDIDSNYLLGEVQKSIIFYEGNSHEIAKCAILLFLIASKENFNLIHEILNEISLDEDKKTF